MSIPEQSTSKAFAKTALLLALLFCALQACLPVTQSHSPLPESIFPLPASISPAARETAGYFETLKNNPPALREFLFRFPKGADIHTHLSGAINAESYITWAEQADLCVYVESHVLNACAEPAADTFRSDTRMTLQQALASLENYRDELLAAFTMKDQLPTQAVPARADHFFESFDKFNAATNQRTADMLAEVLTRAGQQNIAYLELSEFPGSGPYLALGAQLEWGAYSPSMQASLELAGQGSEAEWDAYFRNKVEALNALGFEASLAQSSQDLSKIFADTRALMHCDTAAAAPGCKVEVRWLAQGLRDIDRPGSVFALIMACFQLAQINNNVVGVNFVMREDGVYALRDYSLHMAMMAFFKRRFPQIKLSLHAGELTEALVPAAELADHISQALAIGSDRIGHGVDIAHETDSAALLASMQGRVLVEINLTSNAYILGVTGADHPFMLYAKAGVPLALATDDEGVLRIDLTHEYVRATLEYDLSYFDLKYLAHNALAYSFLPEPEKQQLLQQLEVDFAEFEEAALHPEG